MSRKRLWCPDCDSPQGMMDRRQFLETAATAGVVAASASVLGPVALAGPSGAGTKAASETLVAQLHQTLSEKQKQLCTFPFDHPLRQKVDANWRITKARVGKDFTAEQQVLIKEIFLKLHSAEYAQRVFDQVEHDNKGSGGFGACSIALFGQPGSGKFELVLTGRHVTRRCDGDSVAGAAFGGPIFYGHAAKSFHEPPDHPGNAYWYQAQRANQLFQALDGKQRKVALRDDPRREQGTDTVRLRGKTTELAGLPVSELTADQKELAEQVLEDILAPFRDEDRRECMNLIRQAGLELLHFSYYKNMDIGNDGVWDVWQIEGPSMVWFFRGSPHVHTWVHIRQPA